MIYSAFAVLLAVTNAQINPEDYSCDDPVNNCAKLTSDTTAIIAQINSNALNGMGFVCDEATRACSIECSTTALNGQNLNACELIQTEQFQQFLPGIKGLVCKADPNDADKEYCQPDDSTCDPDNDDCESRYGTAIGFCGENSQCIRPTPAPTNAAPTGTPTVPTAPTQQPPSSSPTPPTQAVADPCCGWTGLDDSVPVRCEASVQDFLPAVKALLPEGVSDIVDQNVGTVEDYDCKQLDGGFCEAACELETYTETILADFSAYLTLVNPPITVDSVIAAAIQQYGSQQATLDAVCAVEDDTNGWECSPPTPPPVEEGTPTSAPTPPTPAPTYDCNDDANFWEPTCTGVFDDTTSCGIRFNMTLEFCQWRSKTVDKLLNDDDKARKRLTRVIRRALAKFVKAHPEVEDYWDTCDEDSFEVLITEFVEPTDQVILNQGRMLGQTDGEECEDIDNLEECEQGFTGSRQTKNYLVSFTVQSLSCGVEAGSADGCESLRAFAIKMYLILDALGTEGVLEELEKAGFDIGIDEDTVCLEGVSRGFGSVQIPEDGFSFCFTDEGKCIDASITGNGNSATGMYTMFAVMSAFIVALFN